MREAHCHIAAYGESLSCPSVAACTGLDECLEIVGSAAAASAGGWVRALGARVEGWREGRWPTLDELDGVTGERPCVVMSFDHHAAMANSAAMRRAGVHPGMAVPPNGVVCTNERTGRATGLLLEQAAYRVWEAAPAPSEADRRRHVIGALRSFAALGFTEVHDLLSPPWLGPLLASLEREDELPVSQVWLYPPADAWLAEHAAARTWACDRVRLRGAKLFLDGTLNSRTALMLQGFADPLPGAPRGRAMVGEGELDAAIEMLGSADSGPAPGHVAVHAIGDGAVRMALDAVDRVRPRPDASGIRIRIEHAELIDTQDVPRLAAPGIVTSVQPCHLLADVEALRRYLPHRLDRVLPLRELIDAGCVPGGCPGDRGALWFGSDAPIVRPDPEDSVRAAVHRRRPGEPEGAAIAPDQRVSDEEAWAAFNGRDAARASRNRHGDGEAR